MFLPGGRAAGQNILLPRGGYAGEIAKHLKIIKTFKGPGGGFLFFSNTKKTIMESLTGKEKK